MGNSRSGFSPMVNCSNWLFSRLHSYSITWRGHCDTKYKTLNTKYKYNRIGCSSAFTHSKDTKYKISMKYNWSVLIAEARKSMQWWILNMNISASRGQTNIYFGHNICMFFGHFFCHQFAQPLTQPKYSISLCFLAIFHKPQSCCGLWKIAKPSENCTWWSL